MAVDHQALADEVDNFNQLSIDQKARARRVAAAHSVDAAECDDFLMMLGIHPTQERDHCAEVNSPVLPSTPHRRNQRIKRA